MKLTNSGYSSSSPAGTYFFL